MSPSPDDVVIVDGARTPIGAIHGVLSGWHPVELLAHLLSRLAERSGIEPKLVDALVVGTSQPVGAQGGNVGRAAVLAAGWPDKVPATVVDADRLSGLQALRVAAALTREAGIDLVVAAGIDVMSLVPPGAAALNRRYGRPWGGVADRYAAAGGLVPAAVVADRLATSRAIGRDLQDGWAAESHQRALAAPTGDLVETPIRVDDHGPPAARGVASRDELPAAASDRSTLAGMRPLGPGDGSITAGNSAPIADGAAAVIVAKRSVAERLGLRQRATLAGFGATAVSPIVAPDAAGAIRHAVRHAGVPLDRMVRVELDDSYAAQTLATMQELDVDGAIVNVDGGSTAIGDPYGVTGLRLVLDLVCGIEVSGGCGVCAATADGGLALGAVIDR